MKACLPRLLHSVFSVFGTLAYITMSAQATDSFTIHFPFNGYQLEEREKDSLRVWVNHLPEKTAIQSMLFVGHCDSVGAFAYNIKLSLLRAAAAKAFVDELVKDDHLPAELVGRGKQYPLNDNSTGALRWQNRRVDIRITYQRLTTAVPSERRVDTIRRSRELPPPDPLAKLADSSLHSGDSLVLPGLVFIGNRHIPMPGSEHILEQLLSKLLERPTVSIEIDGYVCCTDEGRDGLDVQTQTEDLSVRRAKFVYDYLVAHGIGANRLRYKGFGGSNKLYPLEENGYQQLQNRRVSIRILNL
jgi:outer membrane protein OmpA-like peptidoglycan-associated protein